MRVAHIVRRYTAAEWGGTETVVANLAARQAGAGCEVAVFCTEALAGEGDPPPPAGPEARRFPYFYPYWPMGAERKLTLDRKGGNPYAPRLFAAVREWRPDVVHVHACGRLAQCAVRLAEGLGVPSVLTLHGGAAAVPEEERRLMLEPLKGTVPYGGILDRLLGLRFDPIDRATRVVAVSSAEERRLKELHPRARIVRAPNGVPEGRGESAEGRKYGEVRKVVCVSRIDYQKNQLALVELAGAEKGLEVTLVGPETSAWYARKVRARAEELGLGGRFRIVPGLPPGSEELKREYARADAFVLPSLHEPFGIVALEAMREGLPVAAADMGGLKDFVEDGVNGALFAPDDLDGLRAALGKLARRGREFAEAGFATAEAHSWTKVAGTIMETYHGAQHDLHGG